MGAFLSTVNVQQWLTVIVMVGLSFAVNKLLPAGAEHDMLMAAIGALGSQTLVSTRTPSTNGGTTKEAVQIAPAPVGTTLVAAPDVKK